MSRLWEPPTSRRSNASNQDGARATRQALDRTALAKRRAGWALWYGAWLNDKENHSQTKGVKC